MGYVRSVNRGLWVDMSKRDELRGGKRRVASPWRSLAWVLVVLCGLSPAAALAQSSLTGAAATPPQEASAEVILRAPGAGLCPELVGRFNSGQMVSGSGQEDLLVRCREVVRESGQAGGDVGDVQDGLQAMSPEEIATQGTHLIETSNAQINNISSRLAALRAGAGGLGLGQFALVVDRFTVPLNLVASTEPMAAPAQKAQAAGAGFNRFGVFATGSLSLGDRDATNSETGFDFNSYGFTAGADYRFTTNFILGVAVGLSATNIDLDEDANNQDGGGLDALGVTGSIYATYYATQQFFIDAIASIGWSDYDIDRGIRYTIRELNPDGSPTGALIDVNQVAKANTDGLSFGFSLGGGYDFTAGALTFGPVARVNYRWATIDGYQEDIDGAEPGFGLALDVDEQDIESFTTALGLQASYAISAPWGVIQPQLRVEWEHEYMNDSETIKAHFVNDPTPDEDTQIRLNTDGPDRNFFTVGAGLVAAFRRGISAFAQYETLLGLDDITVHHVALGLRVEF